MSDVEGLLEHLDLVIGTAEGVASSEDLRAAARAARETRDRVGHLGSTLVLALLGGTGVGKSSLLNAIAGGSVASVSPIRPHTTRPLAWVPAAAEPGLGALLDRLGVDGRVEHDRLPGVAILDMTDIDSLAEGHRALVEELLPQVDVGLWVLDPSKYADPSLHADFLAPVAADSERLLFVMNRIDTLAPGERTVVVEHLRELLTADGIAEPIIFETAASPRVGDPVGVGSLVEHLRSRLAEKQIRLRRVIGDARSVADRLTSAAGVAAGDAFGFEETWSEAMGSVHEAVARGLTIADRERILLEFDALARRVIDHAGPAAAAEVAELRFDGGLDRAVGVAIGIPRNAGASDSEDMVAVLEERVAAPLRRALWSRARLGAAAAGLAVEAAAAEQRLRTGQDF
ncbi:MAG TPA: GTPase [Acidimicrobiia bacterium]|nr:GTPase [Acidimicrobiia bacterium]